MMSLSTHKPSLRFQLIVYSVCTLLFIGLISILAVKRYAYETTKYTFDRPLANAALQILEEVRLDNGDLIVDMPFSAFSGLSDAPRDKVFYLVTTKKKEFVTGYQSLLSEPVIVSQINSHPLELDVVPHFFDLVFKSQHVRFALVGRVINTSKGAHNVFVIIGQTTEERKNWERNISNIAFKFILGIMICTIIVIVVLINQVLKPIKVINRKISQRSNIDLSLIELEGPEEILHLVKTINRFMLRLDKTLLNMKNFTSEAAHQLKTPLAGMRVQIELMLGKNNSCETIHSLNRILSACDILERTIEQLLNHAMITHRTQSVELKKVNMNSLVKSVCRDLAINALKRNIEISYSQEFQYQVNGDEFSLRQMLVNLIENAIKYSDNNSKVDVNIFRYGTKACILIRDYGIGISDADKPHVFERFYRISNNSNPGSGLGMSIAAEVAKKNHAKLLLHNSVPKGLTVEIQFPYRVWEEVSS